MGKWKSKIHELHHINYNVVSNAHKFTFGWFEICKWAFHIFKAFFKYKIFGSTKL